MKYATFFTKWKIPRDGQPSDGDLKQMYAYNIHFGAKQSILLYPYMDGNQVIGSPYRESEAVKNEFCDHSCSTYFIDLFDNDGYIKKDAGKELVESLCFS